MWYYNVVGENRCPIVDTWWQTETGGILITPFPSATELKPGSATFPFFGITPVILNPDGNELHGNPAEGLLAIKKGSAVNLSYFSVKPWEEVEIDLIKSFELTSGKITFQEIFINRYRLIINRKIVIIRGALELNLNT